jgi:hypothetical protein
MIDEDISSNILSAAIKDLESKEWAAVATIQLYLKNPVAVADHGEIITEITKWAKIGAEARDSKQFLLDKFTEDSSK